MGELPHGDQRATEIMMSLALKPRLLLLDEPTAGMGDQETYDITRLIRRLHKDQKLAIVLIEHDMRVVFHLADRIMVLAGRRGAGRGHAAGDRRQRGGAGRLSGEGSRMTACLEAEDLHTYYGKSHILHGVSLEAARGRDRHPARAQRRRQDHDPAQPRRPDPGARGRGANLRQDDDRIGRPIAIAALGVGYVPEGRRIFANLTVEENLKVPLERPGPIGPSQRVLRALSAPGERRGNKRAASSRAASRRCSRSPRALLLNPKLLLLDEPSQGLAPLIVQEVFRVVTSARRTGISVLLVEQNVRAAVEIADRAYVLDDGHIVFEGSAAEFGADEARVRALAGASAEEWDLAK